MEIEIKKRWVRFALTVTIVILVYLYLRKMLALLAARQSQQIVYPDTTSSGVPSSTQEPSTFNIAVPQNGVSPAAIYDPGPGLGPTPGFLSYNNAPVDIMGGSPITNVNLNPITPATDGGCGCGCADKCSCCSTGGVYDDGNNNTCLTGGAPVMSKTLAFQAQNVQDFLNPQYTAATYDENGNAASYKQVGENRPS